jgi:hypothetical protein
VCEYGRRSPLAGLFALSLVLQNQFDPALRHGYESYSFFSQYNLVPTSMLSQALLVLDETVTQGATPAEVGGFSLSPDEFHVVVANVGGLYAEVEVSSCGPVTFPPRPIHTTRSHSFSPTVTHACPSIATHAPMLTYFIPSPAVHHLPYLSPPPQLFPDTPEHDTLGLTRVHSATTDSLVAMSAGGYCASLRRGVRTSFPTRPFGC